VTTAPDGTVRAMAAALAERTRRLRGAAPSPPVFASEADALERYHRGMATPMARTSAAVLVPRSLKPVTGATPAPQVTWAWDPKWLLRSVLPPSEAQVLAMVDALVCPVLLVAGGAGYETAVYSSARKRDELAERKRRIRHLTEVILPGIGHYPHLDAAPAVAVLVDKHWGRRGMEQARL
jgi:pimeloyl-ACP methyl ester carboxylesterase